MTGRGKPGSRERERRKKLSVTEMEGTFPGEGYFYGVPFISCMQ